MGNALNRGGGQAVAEVQENVQNGSAHEEVEAVRGTKRGLDTSADDEDLEINTLMHTPKKKKLKTTSRYEIFACLVNYIFNTRKNLIENYQK